MNKKILLLLVLTCIMSMIAFKVFAGAAGHSGACGIVCQKAQINSTSGTMSLINVSQSSVGNGSIAVNITCGNSTINPCWNLTSQMWNICIDSNRRYCSAPETEGYNVTTYTNNSVNISNVEVQNGSQYAAWLSKNPTRLNLYYNGALNIYTYIGPNGLEFNPGDTTVRFEQTRGNLITVFGKNTNSKPAGCNLALQSGSIWDEECFDLPSASSISSVFVSDTPVLTSQNKLIWAITSDSGGASSKAYYGASSYDVINGFTLPATINTIESISTSAEIRTLKPMENPVFSSTIAVMGAGFADDGKVRCLLLSIAPDGSLVSQLSSKLGAGTTALGCNDLTAKLAQSTSQSVVLTGLYGPSSLPAVLILKFTPGSTNLRPSAYYIGNTAAKEYPSIAGDTSNVYVAWRDSSHNIARLDSIGNLQTIIQSADATIASTSPVTKLLADSGSIIYAGPNSFGSRIILVDGSTIITAFDVNYTVTDGDVVAAQNTGGHSGDFYDILFGGITNSNHTAVLEWVNISLARRAENPNGTMQFTTDKIVAIQTMSPDINILNFQLRWQNFTGSFDTTKGTCIGCTFDAMGTCQAEVEKIWGMFNTYNLTINLTPDRNITMQNLQMCCRDLNRTIALGPAGAGNCTGLTTYPPSTYSSTGCFTPTTTAPYSYNTSDTVCVYLQNLNTSGIQVPLGTITPTQTCEQIACEINGTWNASNDQTFTINKTITVTAI